MAEVQLLMLFTPTMSHVEKVLLYYSVIPTIGFLRFESNDTSLFFTDGLIQTHAACFPLTVSAGPNINFTDNSSRIRPPGAPHALAETSSHYCGQAGENSSQLLSIQLEKQGCRHGRDMATV